MGSALLAEHVSCLYILTNLSWVLLPTFPSLGVVNLMRHMRRNWQVFLTLLTRCVQKMWV